MSDIYVVDTNIFVHALNNLLPFDVFDYIWEPLSIGMKNGFIVSTDEVYQELSIYWDPQKKKENNNKAEQGEWLKKHKKYFLGMTEAESHIVGEIYRNKKFQESINEKKLRLGNPEADAILVAKAKILVGIVATSERNSKPNSAKVPNICIAQGVRYTTRPDFYRILKNLHTNRPAHENVTIYHNLVIQEYDYTEDDDYS
jgi:hypothetical protein